MLKREPGPVTLIDPDHVRDQKRKINKRPAALQLASSEKRPGISSYTAGGNNFGVHSPSAICSNSSEDRDSNS